MHRRGGLETLSVDVHPRPVLGDMALTAVLAIIVGVLMNRVSVPAIPALVCFVGPVFHLVTRRSVDVTCLSVDNRGCWHVLTKARAFEWSAGEPSRPIEMQPAALGGYGVLRIAGRRLIVQPDQGVRRFAEEARFHTPSMFEFGDRRSFREQVERFLDDREVMAASLSNVLLLIGAVGVLLAPIVLIRLLPEPDRWVDVAGVHDGSRDQNHRGWVVDYEVDGSPYTTVVSALEFDDDGRVALEHDRDDPSEVRRRSASDRGAAVMALLAALLVALPASGLVSVGTAAVRREHEQRLQGAHLR